MSAENVEIVRRFIEAWSAVDRETMAELLHPDAVFHSAVTNVVGKTFHGRDAILAVPDHWEEDWSEIYWEIDELIDVDDHRVVTFHRAFATGKVSGVQTVRELTGVVDLRDGRIVRQWIYLDREEALADAGITDGQSTT